jgi:hypothetical protein
MIKNEYPFLCPECNEPSLLDRDKEDRSGFSCPKCNTEFEYYFGHNYKDEPVTLLLKKNKNRYSYCGCPRCGTFDHIFYPYAYYISKCKRCGTYFYNDADFKNIICDDDDPRVELIKERKRINEETKCKYCKGTGRVNAEAGIEPESK